MSDSMARTYNESCNEEGGKNTGPEAHAAEGNEEDALLAGEVDACLVGQKGFNSNGDQKTCGPDEGDSERELQGNVHHRNLKTPLPSDIEGTPRTALWLPPAPALPNTGATIQS